jgi:membrane dipeptidase
MRTTIETLIASSVLFAFGCSPNTPEAPQTADEVSRSIQQAPSIDDEVHRLHRRVPLIDGHNDLPWQYLDHVKRKFSELDVAESQPQLMTDIPRLREGLVGGQFWSVYVDVSNKGAVAVRATMEEIDVVVELARRYPEDLEMAYTADDVERIFDSGRISSMIGMEGGHSIDNSLATLRMFYRLGARYMTLTHSRNTPWADSATDSPAHGGLTEFGKEVVREMNWLGMLVDLSHVSTETMHDALDVTEAPVIYSHSSARALCDHPRNVPDDVLKRLPDNGGVVMVTFVPAFVSQEVRDHDARRDAELDRLRSLHDADEASLRDGLASWNRDHSEPRATLSQVADHIGHIRDVAGIDHLGIGADFDGITSVPLGLEDVSKYPDLTRELLSRGYADEDVLKILGGNVLRVMRTAEAISRKLRAGRGPSEALIEEVDLN